MNPSVAGGNDAATYVERQVLHWFKDLLGFPASSMGLLVSGGSMATRSRAWQWRDTYSSQPNWGCTCALPGSKASGAVYWFTPAPRAIAASVKPSNSWGWVATTCGSFPVDTPNAACRSMPLTPCCTSILSGLPCSFGRGGQRRDRQQWCDRPTRAVLLDARLCDRYGVWLHVDGAYGAPAI